ncbi:hypothetical protein GH714_023600 [Hevea brasiliensis]|uniref:Rhamnogalacturonase A/B/Epimerase-like pectate lyase domain-containing protein n=1 Tax=Hevea brasiliensis TaxID=3981 RepID=A0A6A6KD37_HEVBR|nr:hypothetical protein GH714_023600 [Hevea brasiliensis]
MLFIAFLVWCSSFDTCIARRGRHWRQNRATSASLYKKKVKSNGSNHHHHNGESKPKPKPPSHRSPLPPPVSKPPKEYAPPSSSPTKGSATFNVRDFGAKGDGKSDDTKAFQSAWAAACKVEASNVLVPSEYEFLVGPISFSGPYCQANIAFQALRFYGSFNATVTGITIQNSPQCHLKFDNCMGVVVHDISISSPGDSPNTDGIHLQNTKDVLVHSSNLACGDDCISIQTGCSNVYVHNVNCGPGHGISIGSLGKDNTKACVSNITVRDVIMHNTMTGVRIKTWQGGSGSVQGYSSQTFKFLRHGHLDEIWLYQLCLPPRHDNSLTCGCGNQLIKAMDMVVMVEMMDLMGIHLDVQWAVGGYGNELIKVMDIVVMVEMMDLMGIHLDV